MDVTRLLSSYDRKIELYEMEAVVLLNSVQQYLVRLGYFSSARPLYYDEGQQLPVLLGLVKRLRSFALGNWPRTRLHRQKPRRFRLQCHELLMLNRLLRDTVLISADRVSLGNAYLKINQQAAGLNEQFEL